MNVDSTFFIYAHQKIKLLSHVLGNYLLIQSLYVEWEHSAMIFTCIIFILCHSSSDDFKLNYMYIFNAKLIYEIISDGSGLRLFLNVFCPDFLVKGYLCMNVITSEWFSFPLVLFARSLWLLQFCLSGCSWVLEEWGPSTSKKVCGRNRLLKETEKEKAKETLRLVLRGFWKLGRCWLSGTFYRLQKTGSCYWSTCL